MKATSHIRTVRGVFVAALFLVLVLAASPVSISAQTAEGGQHPPGANQPPSTPIRNPVPAPPAFGDPLPGLNTNQLADYVAGFLNFQEVETISSGLGPDYNGVSCVACHNSPAVGGSSPTNETRFGLTINCEFNPLTQLEGSLYHTFAIAPACQQVIPREANTIAQRQTTPLFGLGLIEAIPDETLLENAASRKPDGVTGRASIVPDLTTGEMRVGRFGWKAQHALLLDFSADAYLNEIGITSRLFPTENAPNGNTNLLAKYDTVPDPEDTPDASGKADIDRFTDFMRLTAPPPPLTLTASARAGESVFTQLGCAVCHTPAMTTGANDIPALNRKTAALYSDLLLHDMGSLGDGIAQADAGTREMRTAPLWGLRASGPYLHDGRAATVDAAIRGHDGEAERARNRYLQLNATEKKQLLDFLDSI